MYKNIIMKSIRDILDNYNVIGKALVIPTILLLILNFASTSFTQADKNFTLGSLFFTFLSFIVDIVILITVHRILILGNESVPKWGLQKFEQREFSFFIKYFIIAIVFILVVVIITVCLQFIGIHIFAAIFLAMIICSIYISRVSLVFPAIAVDTKMTFKDSLEYTKGFKLLIYVTVIIFPVLFSVVFGGIYALIITALAQSISSHINILLVFLNVTISVFVVSALSNTYIYISESLSNQEVNEKYDEEDKN